MVPGLVSGLSYVLELPPPAAVTVRPVDAGGGPPAQYGAQVLDIFKYGLGVWNAQQQQQNMLDYRRWEATQFGAMVQGKPAIVATSGGQVLGGISGGMLLVVGVALLLVMKK